jgi:hypothetical protein
MSKKRDEPREIFVEIIVRADRGKPKDLKPYVDAAHHAVLHLAIKNSVFCGAIGRRGIVSRRALTRHMTKHGFYGAPHEETT